eukprot:3865755-Rhodomonas_salina.1
MGLRVESREPESRHRVQSRIWSRRVHSRQPRVGGQDLGFRVETREPESRHRGQSESRHRVQSRQPRVSGQAVGF